MTSIEDLRTYQINFRKAITKDAKAGRFHFSIDQFENVASILFSSIISNGFLTFIVNGRSEEKFSSPQFDHFREQARLGKEITYIFLLPHLYYQNEPWLRKHVELDVAAGIKVRFLLIEECMKDPLLESNNLEFGILDDKVVCWARKKTLLATTYEWIISEQIIDLDLAQEMRAAILAKNTFGVASLYDESNLEGSLIKSAPAMATLADCLCNGDYIDRENCSWYHKPWQYFRLFDLISTPTWHSSFYLSALSKRVGKRENRKILVSGTADYSMIALVLNIYEKIGASCDITVLDLCDTPLLMSKWYASTKNINIMCVKHDILEYEPNEKFDFIVTDAFLTRFTPELRQKVVDRWMKILCPGGMAVTTIHIEPSSNGIPEFATEEQVDNFLNKLDRQSELWQEYLLTSSDDIKKMARQFWDKAKTNPMRNRDEIQRLFRNAGFEIELYQENWVKGELKPTLYAEIVACTPVQGP